MSRGMLDHADWERIYEETPDLSNLGDMVLHLPPGLIAVHFAPESGMQEVPAIFHDVFHTLEYAVYALREVFAHQIWYLEKKDPPNKMAAVAFGRYYADDAALRLYSAGEQYLVDALKIMLEIRQKRLKRHKDRTKVKWQKQGRHQRTTMWLEVLGDYLRQQEATSPIADAVAGLAESQGWRDTVEYRDRWVHEQPPTVKELGVVYRRGRRWKPSPTGKGYTVEVGGGDVAEYSVEDLVAFIQPAMFQFAHTLASVVKYYMELLTSHGERITFSDTSGATSISIT